MSFKAMKSMKVSSNTKAPNLKDLGAMLKSQKAEAPVHVVETIESDKSFVAEALEVAEVKVPLNPVAPVKETNGANNTTNTNTEIVDGEKVVMVDVSKIIPHTHQARQVFDDTEFRDLVDSISKTGLIHPVVLFSEDEGKSYQVISGERRWRAFKELGYDKIKAIILTDRKEALIRSYHENIHSKVSFIEEAYRWHEMIKAGVATNLTELGRVLGVNHGTMMKASMLYKLTPNQVQLLIKERASRRRVEQFIRGLDATKPEKLTSKLFINFMNGKPVSVTGLESLSDDAIKMVIKEAQEVLGRR